VVRMLIVMLPPCTYVTPERNFPVTVRSMILPGAHQGVPSLAAAPAISRNRPIW
jgi:hypothetical protein